MKQLETSRILARSIRGAWCCAVMLTLVCGSAARSRAEEPSLPGAPTETEDVHGAEAYAAQAFKAYARRDYEKAVALYFQAYEATPSADILFNIARVHDVGLQDVALSISFYRDYVRSPDAEPQRIEIARERIKRLSAIERAVHERAAHAAGPAVPGTPAAGTTAATGAAALGTAASDAARHRAATATTSAEAPDTGAWTPWRVGAVVAGGIGVVSIGLGAGFGISALADAATARAECAGNLCNSRRGVEAARAAAKSADIATVGFGLGGSLLAASLASILIDLDGPPGRDVHGSPRLHPVATTSELGIALSGRW